MKGRKKADDTHVLVIRVQEIQGAEHFVHFLKPYSCVKNRALHWERLFSSMYI